MKEVSKAIDEDDNGSEHSSNPASTVSSTEKQSEGTDTFGTVGHKDSRRILYLRIVLIVVLIGVALGTATVIYRTIKQSEDLQFQTHYQDNAVKILESFKKQFRHTVGAIDNYGIVSSTQAENEDWPFRKAPKFEVRGASSRSLANVELLAIIPMVTNDNRPAWEAYSVNNSEWVYDELAFNLDYGFDDHHDDHEGDDSHSDHDDHHDHGDHSGEGGNEVERVEGIATSIYVVDWEASDHASTPDNNEDALYWPLWQSTPVRKELINFNLVKHITLGQDLARAIETGKVVIGRIAEIWDEHDSFHFLNRAAAVIEELVEGEEDHHDEDNHGQSDGDHLDDEGDHSDHDHRRTEGADEHDHDDHDGEEDFTYGYDHDRTLNEPLSMSFFPIFDQIQTPRNLVGFVTAAFFWTDFLAGILPPGTSPIFVVLENTCGQIYSLQVVGGQVETVGIGDLHDTRYNDNEIQFDVMSIANSNEKRLTFSGVPLDTDYCPMFLRIYPTRELEEFYSSSQPLVSAIAVLATFVFVSAVFIGYDYLVSIRQKKISQQAKETGAVVDNLFPANVRDRLLQHQAAQKAGNNTFLALDGGLDSRDTGAGVPIADLFLKASVLFADIANFTAWSSSREPNQVFGLLEAVYGNFDKLARKHHVFKVETIGDCYVAATGLPEIQEDHAERIVRFASVCIAKMNILVRELEVTLGPDTGDLKMRFGIHSGPVTAGVLRGERSRFQLFGDTVNTAARMENHGMSGRIHCSRATAEELTQRGKSRWVIKRENSVHVKGKGNVQTFWVHPDVSTTVTSGSCSDQEQSRKPTDFCSISTTNPSSNSTLDDHLQRLVDWNVDLLHRLLKQLISSRDSKSTKGLIDTTIVANPISDVKEAIEMPTKASDSKRSNEKPGTISPKVQFQLRKYVTTIARMYRKNPFHNFDHASHVTLSAQKLLNRIVQPRKLTSGTSGVISEESEFDQSSADSDFSAYGITLDSLTHFAIIFSTMIHDVDHCGVSNGQLIQERAETAIVYEGKCVAEQNSIDLSWELLMEDEYKDLRECIFTNQKEYNRFRSLVVNSVIATDIFDPELKTFRNSRWKKAFNNDVNEREVTDLKATIVIEHLIQSADVAHTMQHWHVYRKWNEKLFMEMYTAFKENRATKDPSEGWHNGELWFFDNYIIPLAKKLRECKVFGVSSDEFLNYATSNRREWESKGEKLVQEWLCKWKDGSTEEEVAPVPPPAKVV